MAVIHEFRDFEFHDAKLRLTSLSDGCLKLCGENVILHHGTEFNQSPADMHIDKCEIVFDGFELAAVKPGREPAEDFLLITGDEAMSVFLDEFKTGVTVFDFEDITDELFALSAVGKEPFFTVLFGFSSFSLTI